jgi:hypothetical protein
MIRVVDPYGASWHDARTSLSPLNFGHGSKSAHASLTETNQPDAQLHTNDRLPSNTQSHIMDTAKAPVKLVKVTRVLGRTGTQISIPFLKGGEKKP